MNGFSIGGASGRRSWRLKLTHLAISPILGGLFARYFSASVVSLCADSGCFLLLLHFSAPPTLAASLGFTVGIGVNWLVSSRILFTGLVAAHGPARQRQLVSFLATALLGLVLTTGIVGAASALAFNPRLAKLVAVAVSFVTTSALRHVLVFNTQPQA